MRVLSKRLCNRKRGRRGQTLVISALIMLLVAVAVMVTFAIGYRTREKIKLQAVADAGAYSLAVAEARTFNYMAWSNRARVAHDVSILSIHSHQSYLGWYDDLMRKTGWAHNVAGGVMAGECIPCALSGVCCQNCANSWRAFKVGRLYSKTIHNEFHRKLYEQGQRYDKALSRGSKTHEGFIGTINGSQKMMLADLKSKALGTVLKKSFAGDIANTLDRRMESGDFLSGGVNVAAIDAAVGWSNGKGEDWLEITAGTRYPAWLTRRGFVYASGHWWDAYRQALEQAGSCIIVPVPPYNAGNSKVLGEEPLSYSSLRRAIRREGDNRSGWAGFPSGYGHAYGAYDEGIAFALWICDCPAPGAYPEVKGGAFSDPNEQAHKHGYHLVHGSRRAEPQLHGLGGCDREGHCGIYGGHMRMKLSTEQKQSGGSGRDNFLWNQPHTVSVVTKEINRQRFAWDFDFRTELPMPLRFTTMKSQADRGTPMAAIAGGLAYYHKPNGRGSDDWREPPSLWNPFWRAKLHPLRSGDATAALMGHPSGRVLLQLAGDGINY